MAGILEAAVLRGGVPGGHSLLLHRLEHHCGPAAHFVERRDIERADLAGPVAFETMRLKQRDDVAVECRGGFGGEVAVAVERDQAADRFGARHGDGAAGEEIVERGGEFVGRRGGAGDAGGELIVDPAGVDHASEPIDHHHSSGAGGAKRPGDPLAGIHHERERHPCLPGHSRKLLGRILAVGIDADHAHASIGIVGGDRLEAAAILPGDRATGAEKGDHMAAG